MITWTIPFVVSSHRNFCFFHKVHKSKQQIFPTWFIWGNMDNFPIIITQMFRGCWVLVTVSPHMFKEWILHFFRLLFLPKKKNFSFFFYSWLPVLNYFESTQQVSLLLFWGRQNADLPISSRGCHRHWNGIALEKEQTIDREVLYICCRSKDLFFHPCGIPHASDWGSDDTLWSPKQVRRYPIERIITPTFGTLWAFEKDSLTHRAKCEEHLMTHF